MPKKYHIDVHPTPNRLPAIGRSGIVDWGEGCLKCAKCVKHMCVYNVYRQRSFSVDIMADTIDELCKNCFRCVQGCPKRLIHKTMNPEWESLGDDIYTPEIIAATWDQAATGKIPVSGAGYGGRFSGPGFDSMWTDMSEIVRPTRDGIHGREYISTVVDIGSRPASLSFDTDGKLLTKPNPSIRVPIPILFDLLPFGDVSDGVFSAMAMAASRLQTLMFVSESQAMKLLNYSDNIIPVLDEPQTDLPLDPFRMVEISDGPNARIRINDLKSKKSDLLVSIRIPAISSKENLENIVDYHHAGFDLIHYVADERGYEPATENGLHLKDLTKEAHAALLSAGIRDQVTFMVSGGVAMAEHVIKSILCGANIVGIDVPMLIALECRVCRNCREGGDCPASVGGIDPKYGARRIINLIGAWHNQLLEMMGAMGIREVRRLRGEQGRVMFRESLENDTFAQIFGNRK